MTHIKFTPFPELTTTHLSLRQLTIDDENEIYFIRTDPGLNRYVNKPPTKSLEDVKQFIEKINQGIFNNESIYWVICIKETGQFAGTICLWNIDPENHKAETGYTLLPEFHGNGFMQEALNKIIEFGFLKMKLARIEAYTHRDNKASIKLLKTCLFNKNEVEPTNEDPNMIVYFIDNKTNYQSS